jgi:uncharacterized membrane protein YkvA (DUF1232 family)
MVLFDTRDLFFSQCLEDGVHLAFQLRILLLAVFFFLYLLSPLDLVPEVSPDYHLGVLYIHLLVMFFFLYLLSPLNLVPEVSPDYLLFKKVND